MKAVKIAVNRSGNKIALVAEPNGLFAVYAHCGNYAGYARGGVSYTWRYFERGLTRADADRLFAKRVVPAPLTRRCVPRSSGAILSGPSRSWTRSWAGTASDRWITSPLCYEDLDRGPGGTSLGRRTVHRVSRRWTPVA